MVLLFYRFRLYIASVCLVFCLEICSGVIYLVHKQFGVQALSHLIPPILTYVRKIDRRYEVSTLHLVAYKGGLFFMAAYIPGYYRSGVAYIEPVFRN